MRRPQKIQNSPRYKQQSLESSDTAAYPGHHRHSCQPIRHSAGFTLLEVLVALVIVGTALGASLRAIGSLTQNSSDLHASVVATWSAENRLMQIRLAREWPALGLRRFDCAQGGLQLICEENVFATPNPFFRRVEVSVFDTQNAGDTQNTGRRIIKLAQVVPNVQ